MANNSEFDEYAKTYSGDLRSALRPFAADPRSILTTKANVLCSVVRSSGLSPRDCRLLDVGCGIGLLTAELVRWFDSVTGVDVSARSIDYAAENDKRTAYVHYDGGKLPFEMNSFDVVLASCVLHHVSVSNRGAFVQEMARVARAGGIIILLEHNPINPVTRYTVANCRFDEKASLVPRQEACTLLRSACGRTPHYRYYGFLPFRNARIDNAERAICWLPIGAQYAAWVQKA